MINGKSYSISEIFDMDCKIVIPDMQRDYCWASTTSENEKKSLIEIFINDLIEKQKENLIKEIQLGILYAYEYPLQSNNIQLCDGQQRITTLYILIGLAI